MITPSSLYCKRRRFEQNHQVRDWILELGTPEARRLLQERWPGMRQRVQDNIIEDAKYLVCNYLRSLYD
jgi:hypothetical protein